MYQVEFAGDKVPELAPNIIAESIVTHSDTDGNKYLLLDVLVDYNKDNKTMSLIDQQTSIWGRQVSCKTTAAWQICCQWKNGSTSWKMLSNLKESHPMQTTELAVAHGIDHEPAFYWWVEHVLKNKDRIIASIRKQQTRYFKKSPKFGIQLPKTVEKILALDAKNGNTLWADAISKEMGRVRVAFDVLTGGKTVHINHQCV